MHKCTRHFFYKNYHNSTKTVPNEESAQRDANTAHCPWRRGPSSISLPNLKWIALFVQNLLGWSQISPHRRSLPGGTGRPKFNQLEMVTTFTYKPSLVRIDTSISSYRGNRCTNTHPQTGPITIHCGAKLSAQCNYPATIPQFLRAFTCLASLNTTSGFV